MLCRNRFRWGVHRREDDLCCGVAAYRGSQQSLKVTSNGLVMCTDYSVMPFRKRMPVLDFLKEHVWEIQGVDDQKYAVSRLTDKLTKDISFEQEDLEGKKEPDVVKLTDYFRDKWDKEIMHKGIPCLKLGNGKKPNYVPMEFCVLAEDRSFPRVVNAEVIKNFEVEVGMNMTEVDGHVIEPPKLKLGSLNGKTNIITVDKQKCHYNLTHGKTLVAGKLVERWALIDFSSMHHKHRLDANFFIPKLKKRRGSIGVRMEEPLWVYPTSMNELSDLSTVRSLFNWLVKECRKIDMGRLQMIVCVMPDTHHGYKYIKLVSEIEIGVMTQCCLSENANKATDQFLANLGMKINAKLGGANMELVERFPHFSNEDHFMFIGAGVNHPAASNTSSPSIAAVVGSVNWSAATRYAARVKPTHYSLIWDENGFSSDEMQKLIYDLCYIFARCTKPVSLVPLVYYADLVAYRGRMFQEVVMEMEASGSRSVSSFDQFFYNLDQHLKDSMFFI
ncbi:hypothetical protein L1987_38932 [Smallanthus sonchifolius]|uniref:Uncharacterized protein n=1 Tax=Smallanthus sonchifolius TaxID=185202 RepID=A0ACB9HMD7_9ASTR|nr:hypothetical protein L1987_38932 [Smallanthus sonchifolius]